MQISKLNPLGYEATTKKGNKYKATNTNAATLAACSIAPLAIPVVVPLFVKNPKEKAELKNFSLKKMFQESCEQVFKRKFSQHQALTIIGLVAILDLVLSISYGHAIDEGINRKRAKKADEKAEILNAKV